MDVVWRGPALLGEGIVWDADSGVLWWCDLEGRCLHRWTQTDGRCHRFATLGRVGSFALTDDGRLLLAMEQGFAWMDPVDGAVMPVIEADLAPENRFNDGRCDRAGRFLAGSMNLARNGPNAGLWSIDAGLEPKRIVDGVSTANGLGFSPDGRRMWWADSPAECVYEFDYDTAEGVASNRRVWLEPAHAPGRPDGAAVDADGCYWSARWRGGCVARFTPDGRLDRTIDLPVSRVTMCAFGGSGLDTMFITTASEGLSPEEVSREPLAGAVFAVRPGVCGLLEPRFRTG